MASALFEMKSLYAYSVGKLGYLYGYLVGKIGALYA
jgi:hypothetical protein